MHRMFPIHFYCSPKDPLLATEGTRFMDDGIALGSIVILRKITLLMIASTLTVAHEPNPSILAQTFSALHTSITPNVN